MTNFLSDEALGPLRDRLRQAFDPVMLHKDYRKGWSQDNPDYGFCSVASEAAWFLLGGRQAGWVACHARDHDGTTHWWLRHRSGYLFDPTRDQYDRVGRKPPYERGVAGRPGGFMGIRVDPDSPWPDMRRPSRRAAALLERMGVVPGEQFRPASRRSPRP